jgi:hypothetical protein
MAVAQYSTTGAGWLIVTEQLLLLVCVAVPVLPTASVKP